MDALKLFFAAGMLFAVGSCSILFTIGEPDRDADPGDGDAGARDAAADPPDAGVDAADPARERCLEQYGRVAPEVEMCEATATSCRFFAEADNPEPSCVDLCEAGGGECIQQFDSDDNAMCAVAGTLEECGADTHSSLTCLCTVRGEGGGDPPK